MFSTSTRRLFARSSSTARRSFAMPFAVRMALLGAILSGWSFKTAPTAIAKRLTPAMQTEFGAAAWIPEDAGFFAASYRTRERWEAFSKTEAYRELLTMPAVQMGLGWLQQQPYLGQLAMMRAQNPLLDQAVNVLQDAFSQEVFVCVDKRGPVFANRLGAIYNSFYLNSFLQGINEGSGALPAYTEEKNLERVLLQILESEEDLQIPGTVFGFRLSNPQAGHELMANLAPLLQQMLPLPIAEESLAEGEYLTLPLNAIMFLNPQVQNKITEELESMGLGEETIKRLIEFLKSQSLSISLGMRGDYLIVSFGADNTHLNNMGVGTSLAGSDALAPLRKHFKPRMIGMSFVHRDWTSARKLDVAGLKANLQELLELGDGQLPPGLAERITKDANKLLGQINETMPEAAPYVSASFWNQGVECFSFSALFPGTLSTVKPLTILSHAGKSPLMALAAHSPPSQPGYDQMVEWLQVFYGYFEDYAVPQIPAEGLIEFKQFEALALPALERIHVTTRDLLLPSLEGGQSLFVLDAGGAVTKSPETKEPLAEPIRFPRPAMVVEVNDPRKFIAAWVQYRDIFNTVMTEIRELKPEVEQFQLPKPKSRQEGNAMLYTYDIPAELELPSYLNNDFEPHALLTSKHLVLSLSPRHSEQLLATHSLPQSSLVDLRQPSGHAVWFDFQILKDLVFDDAEVILALVLQEGHLDPTVSMLANLHIDKLRTALGAIRNYRSHSFEEDGLRVNHSWLHLQDIER